MARKKFSKAAAPAKAKAQPAVKTETPAAPARASEFSLSFAGDNFSMTPTASTTWAALEASLKPWLAGKTGHDVVMRYFTPLVGAVTTTMTRQAGTPYTAVEALQFAREFVSKEMQLYREKPAATGGKKSAKASAAPAADDGFEPDM